jgi:transcriptional regulator with XRE-family HTH domain
VNKKYVNFGMKLRLFRNREKITQEKFCEVVGCTPRTLYRWEKGQSFPMEVYRPKILEALPDLGKI